MRRFFVVEHQRFRRGTDTSEVVDGQLTLSADDFDRLRRADERLAERDGHLIFNWRLRFGQATQWVGVIQLPELSIEVLPKIQRSDTNGELGETPARKNLMHMLSTTGDLPLRDRDLASQAVVRAPMLEALIGIFAERLWEALRMGVERAYVERRENLGVLRGKLEFSPHIKLNAARRERLFCAYDEFEQDTWLNRILRAAARKLVLLTHVRRTQDRLRNCLVLLDGVTDIEVQDVDFDRVHLNRQNERFRTLLDFCRLILSRRSPSATSGADRTFALFFDMNIVFEAYIAALMRRYVLREDLSDIRAFPQSRGQIRHLVFRPAGGNNDHYIPEQHGTGVYALQADLLLRGRGTQAVLDTKWKVLRPGGRQGVSRDDLLQLYAYGTRYKSATNILLYPRVAGVSEDLFHLPLSQLGLQNIAVRFVNLARDLLVERQQLVAELRALIRPAFAHNLAPTGEPSAP